MNKDEVFLVMLAYLMGVLCTGLTAIGLIVPDKFYLSYLGAGAALILFGAIFGWYMTKDD